MGFDILLLFVVILAIVLALCMFAMMRPKHATGGGDDQSELRKYTKKDAKKIHKIHPTVFAYSKLPTPTIDELSKFKGWVVEKNNEIAAFLLYTHFTSPTDKKKWYGVATVGTNPKYQRQGLGRQLMDKFHKYADVQKMPSFLQVEEDTELTKRLIKWYSSYGYEVKRDKQQSKYDSKVFLTVMHRTKPTPVDKSEEYEYRFKIDSKQEMVDRLKALGATHRLEALMPLAVYIEPGADPKADDFKYIRVRHEGDRINLTVKTDTKAKFVKEYEVQISKLDGDPIEEIGKMMKALGYILRYKVEKIRDIWDLPGAHEIVFDSYPGVPTYMEVDADSEAILDKITEDLGLDPEDHWKENMYNDTFGFPPDREPILGAQLTFQDAKSQFEGMFTKNEDIFDTTLAEQQKYIKKHNL